MIVTLDGPAGAGKSTAARALAARLGWCYLDTGAMYRTVALVALERGIALEDAAALSFPDRSFDVVFHNGLWVVFPADDQIRLLLNEQLRVTRRYGVAIVHNALNTRLVARFASLAKTDPLYSIRFFTPEQIRELVRPCLGPADRLSIEKFGGPADHGYGIQQRAPRIGEAAAALPPRLYRFQPWSATERIAVVIDRGARR